jgi:hypothetical protein
MTDQPTDHLTQTGIAGTEGELEDESVSIRFGGACPVQGFGTVLGEYPCYYRARGSSWSLEVYEPGTDLEGDGLDDKRSLFHVGESCYAWPDAGWLSAAESCANIRKGVAAFLARAQQGVRYSEYSAGVSSQRTLEKSEAQEPHPQDPKVAQRMAELRFRLVGLDLGKLLQDATALALTLHEPDVDTSDLRAALVRGIAFGLRGDPRPVVDVARELEALGSGLTGRALVSPEPEH